MNWINLRTETLRSGDFANANPGAIETWLRVLAYCCEQENNGCIMDAAKWTDRGWMTTCGVTTAEIKNAHPLIYDDGVAVFVTAFPTEKQAEVQAKRKAGKRGGRRSALSRALSTPSKTDSTEGEGEGERNGNNKGTTVPAASPPVGMKDVLPTSPEAIAIAQLFNRRFATAWSAKEIAAFRDGMKRASITLEAIETVSTYYKSERAKGGCGIHRRDLLTFLNHFDGELDRANAFKSNPKAHDRTNSNQRADSNRNVGHNANLDYSKRSSAAQARIDAETRKALAELLPGVSDAQQ